MLATAGTMTIGLPRAMAEQKRMIGANNRIGIGLIGCGNYGNNLIDVLLKHHTEMNVGIHSICDIWKPLMDTTAEKIRKKTGSSPHKSTRYQDVLNHPEVDAVIIASPDFAHCRQMIDAANAGKHIYVEKPMATRMADANAALDAVRASNIVCHVGTQRRADPKYIGAAHFFHENQPLGQIINAEANWNVNDERWVRDYSEVRREDVDWEAFLMDLPFRPFNPHMVRMWRLYRECCHGPIGLLGTHLIDVATWFLDDSLPSRVVGFGDHMLWKDRRETMDYQHCIYSFPKGWVLQFQARFQNSHGGSRNRFFGTNGIFDTDTWEFRGDGGGKNRLKEVIKAPVAEGLGDNSRYNLLADWVQCMHHGGQPLCDINHGYAHSVASIMGFQACLTGKPAIFDSHKRTIRLG